ncbi:AI-2E family transporter [Bacillus sp. AGMB 02131]|uniref:AI-2E family transporter n=1 Tax=Peribacillus faecalis TaxID=2772559 RepID=A0A927D1Z8_9BACI|nr:AI-2E family transporter [Peribacillus faecalis]MBD3110095.1 AI-2E family transporter [Peribacillus faecalis]
MEDIIAFFRSKGFSKIITLLILVLLLYSLGSMIHLVLFTFLFAFLMGRLQMIISHQLDKVVKINPKIILLIIYTAVVLALVLVLYKYLPIISLQIRVLVMELVHFYNNPPEGEIFNFVISTIDKLPLDLESNVERIYTYASEIGGKLIQVLISIVLSLFLLLEKDKILDFVSRFKEGYFSTFFINMELFGKKFINTFGKVIEVQFLIASTNAVISIIGLWLMDFPQLIGLGIMIFFLGLIPVVGVIISLVPLCMIAYNIGGISTVIAVVVMIAVIHALEAYVLNPKFMSVKTNLPTFVTLAVLLVSEHFLGVWGLIIGIPIFIFAMDMLEIPEEDKVKEKTT